MNTDTPFLALTIGNTRTTVATFSGGTVSQRRSLLTSKTTDIVSLAIEWWGDIEQDGSHIIMAASNEDACKSIAAAISDQTSQEVWMIGSDLPPAIGQHLDPETITGVDRLLNAAAAWDLAKEACIVIDAGTCVTVDFVDGEGTFHGGAIAPGARMQLHAMHEGTSTLPDVEFDRPLREAFGKNTAQAMLQGVFHGIRGMVRQLAEQYAVRYGAYPRVIATGGDATLLFEEDELIEQIIDDLQLQGVAISLRHAMTADEHA